MENRVEDFTIRWDNEWKLTKAQTLEFGFQVTHNQVLLDTTIANQNADNNQESGTQWSYYLQDRLLIAEKLELNVGGRINVFEPINEVRWEPRLSLGLPLSATIKLKGSWGLYHQFINRVTITPFGNQDQFYWVLANGANLPLTKSQHATAGVTWANDDWVVDLEVYHKDTKGIMEAEFIIFPGYNEFDFLNIGNSNARGLDLFLQKSTGKHTAWVSYSRSNVEHTFNTLIQGRVVDEATGEPLPYAHIFAMGTAQGGHSNADGYFSLIDLVSPTTLQISYLGYQPTLLNLEDLENDDAEIKLQKEPQVLQELVVGTLSMKFRTTSFYWYPRPDKETLRRYGVFKVGL